MPGPITLADPDEKGNELSREAKGRERSPTGKKENGVELPNQSVIDFPPLSIPPSLIACAHWQKLVLVAARGTRYQPGQAKR